jgi:hypothetical protein
MHPIQIFILGVVACAAAFGLVRLVMASSSARTESAERQREIEHLRRNLRRAEEDRDDARKRRDELYARSKVDADALATEKADHEESINAYCASMTLMAAVDAAKRSGKPTIIKLTAPFYFVLGAPKFPPNLTLTWDGDAPDFHVINREGVEVVRAAKS